MEMKKFEILNLIYNTCVLTSKEKLVAQYFVYKSNRKGECYPSVSTIAAHCGLSERTVQRATKKLREENYITIHKRYYKGRQSSNEYQLNIEIMSAVTECKCEYQSSVSAEAASTGTAMEYVSFEELLGCEMEDRYKEVDIAEVVGVIPPETELTVGIKEVEGENLSFYDYDELDQDILQFSKVIVEEKEKLLGLDISVCGGEVIKKNLGKVCIWIKLIVESVIRMWYYICGLRGIKDYFYCMVAAKGYFIVCFNVRDRSYFAYYIRDIPLIYTESFFMPFLGVT